MNTLSVCLGGTLTAIGLAHNAAIGDRSIKSATFLNTLTDFSVPGALGVFTDEATIAGLEKQMAKKGFLDSDKMAHTFDALRANDLVFQYVVNNWLLGKKPPAFDLLVWNKDSTRMPAKMHSQYLRSCYLRNEFARGEFEVDGHTLDPAKVDIDTYVLSAVDDHIVPWVSGYKTTQLLGGHNRFVLSTSGHIAGIVNPPSPKAQALDQRRAPGGPAGVEGQRPAAGRHLVGGLGHVDRRAGRSQGRAALPASAARSTRRSRLRPAATSALARDTDPTARRTTPLWFASTGSAAHPRRG